MFSKSLPHVKAHEFELLNSTEAEERIAFDSGLELEIAQSGCDAIRQEFRFFTSGDYRAFPDSAWAREAVRQLVFLSSLSAAQAPLKPWADALETVRPNLKLGETTPLAPDVSTKIDRIVSPDRATMIVVFSQEAN